MFSDPEKVIDQCSIQVGMDIADLGAGSGGYSIAAAKSLISTGRVYSVGVHKDLLVKLKNRATREGLYNIEVIWGDIEAPNGTKLREMTIDLALVCNVLFQVENQANLLKEIKRILKPGGRVLLVDWADSFGGLGPEPKAVIKKDAAMNIFEQAGFHLDREVSAGAHHYGMLFKKL